MTVVDGPVPLRAEGIRLPYGRLPAQVRGWAEYELGAPVVEARTQPGGMSPGCAARLRTADGGTIFLKAVGAELNPDTPGLFRHELAVLRSLPPAPYRPGLLASYDDGDWVGLLLEHVEGRHPDFADDDDAAAAWSVVRTQARELTPGPAGLTPRPAGLVPGAAGLVPGPAGLPITTVPDTVRRWAERWRLVAAEPARYLPDWAVPHAGAMCARVPPLAGRVAGQTLCHWDVRNDNMLVRPGGQAVIFDWGMARTGPAWGDEFCLALEWAGAGSFDTCLAGIARRHSVSESVLTDMVIALAGSLAWSARQPAMPGLPSLPGFCDQTARRLFRSVETRWP